MAASRTYLDHNATAPLRPEARVAMLAALDVVGNASSVHTEGRRARALVEDAREHVAALVGAKPEEVVFTSGATEANATVIAGRAWGSIVTSCIEHPSVLDALPPIHSLLLAADSDGRAAIDDDLVPLLSDDTRLPGPVLVSLQLVNGETGVIQDVAELARMCRRLRPDAVIHTDAVQAAGRLAVDFGAVAVDAMSISSHKLGGPQGVGALILRDGLQLAPLVRGGGHERGRRSGTESVAAIAGFGAAAAAASRAMAEDADRLGALRRALEEAVVAITPNAVIVGSRQPRIANTTCIALPGARAETLVIQLDMAGLAISAGSACSSGKVGPNRTLVAMGVDPALARGAIRVSLGPANTAQNIARFIAAWAAIHSAQAGRTHHRAAVGAISRPIAHVKAGE